MPNASWPRGCLIEGIGIHPFQPWLAAACTNAYEQHGAVLVLDALTGTLRSSTELEDYVGWSSTPNLLRWHPSGDRLTTNVSTNGIALLRRGEFVGFAYPDETRDGGVRHVWVDDRIFTDTGALFEICEGDERFDFDPITSLSFDELQWNAAIAAVVGTIELGIAGFDPIAAQLRYETRFEAPPWRSGTDWSAGGRCYVRRRFGQADASDELEIFDGDTGQRVATIVPSLPRIDATCWGPAGALLVHCHASNNAARHLDVVRNGQIEITIDLGPRRIEASHSVPEASGIAWSPSGDGIALLLDSQEVGLFDARTGRMLTSFPAPAPAIPRGLPDWYRDGHRPAYGPQPGSPGVTTSPGDLVWPAPHRLVRIAPHFIAVWSLDGHKLAELIVPTQ